MVTRRLVEPSATRSRERRLASEVDDPIHMPAVTGRLGRPAGPMEPVRYFVETAAADGIIFTHTRPHDERAQYLIDRKFPFITHGRTEIGEAHPFYDFDNERFTAAAVKRLHERGRKRLALLP